LKSVFFDTGSNQSHGAQAEAYTWTVGPKGRRGGDTVLVERRTEPLKMQGAETVRK